MSPKFSNPNIGDSREKIRIRIRIFCSSLVGGGGRGVGSGGGAGYITFTTLSLEPGRTNITASVGTGGASNPKPGLPSTVAFPNIVIVAKSGQGCCHSDVDYEYVTSTGGNGYSGGGGFGNFTGGSGGTDGQGGSKGGQGTGENIELYKFNSWTLTAGEGGKSRENSNDYRGGGGGGILVNGDGPETSLSGQAEHHGKGFGGGSGGQGGSAKPGIILLEIVSTPL